MHVKGMIPDFNNHPKNSISINVFVIDRFFRFETETTSGLPYTLCDSLTEVLKRTWNTWIEEKPIILSNWKVVTDAMNTLERHFANMQPKHIAYFDWTDKQDVEFKKELLTLMKQVMKRNA